jgi:phenylpropionate dioxygenase-like ring-hydroxylating dioxygenase large terminal subunit
MYPFSEGSYAVRNAWYVVAFSHEVTRSLMERWILNEPVVLYRREDGVAVAIAGRCPHRHFPLAAGSLQGDTLVCGYHGIAFNSDGRCVRIPTEGRTHSSFDIRKYPLVERWKWLWAWTGDPELADEALIPDHEAINLGRAESPSFPVSYHLVNGRYQLMHDNLLDLSHLAFLHSTKIGVEEVATTRDTVSSGPNWVRSMRLVEDAPSPPAIRERFGDAKLSQLIDFTFYAPALHVGLNRFELDVVTENESPTKVRLIDSIVFHAVTPATKHLTHYFFAVTHNIQDPSDLDNSKVKALALAVIEEDLRATELIERMLQGLDEKIRDRLTAGDTAVDKGRRILQSMMSAEARILNLSIPK